MNQSVLLSFVTTTLLLFSQLAQADQFHYSNLVIGDRALGMAGAYTGVSDDASGVFYNPAGLAFALSNDVSGSANALYTRETTYKSAVGNSDFVENSSGTLPSFFGGLQKLDHLVKGLVFAFGVYSLDSDLKDQDDVIEDVNLGQPSNCPNTLNPEVSGATGIDRPATVLDRFHRTVNLRAATLYMAAGVGWRAANNLSLGFSLNYVTVDELVQEYQDVRTNLSLCQNDGGFQSRTEQKSQNIRQHLKAYGVQPTFAMQWAFSSRFSLGATIKLGTYASQSFEQSFEDRSVALTSSDQAAVDGTTGDTISSSAAIARQNQAVNKSDRPLGSLPVVGRVGLAYFHSTRLLMTFDTVYYSSVKNTDNIAGVGELYQKDKVINFAAGMEYYLIPSVPVRLGYFTNNDARPAIDKDKSGQRDHIDYNGVTAFLAWVQPNSQIGVGVMLQNGKGKAQKIAGSKQTQDVESDSFTFSFSATHSF